MAAGDCISGVCGAGNTCSAPACDDNVTNGNETDEDCGGSCPDACDDGLSCDVDGDCKSLVCDPLTDTCSAAAATPGATTPAADVDPFKEQEAYQNAFSMLKSFISRPCTIDQLPLPSVVHGKPLMMPSGVP